jgi:probable HAF family extracellular repeat protein
MKTTSNERKISLTLSSQAHAISYSIVDLGGIYTSSENAISNNSQAVGTAYQSNTLFSSLTSWTSSNGTFSASTSFIGVGSKTYAEGINNNGQMVGYYVGNFHSVTTAQHAFLFSYSNGLTDLGTLGGANSQANGINDSGQVVGWSNTAGNTATHAVLYNNGAKIDLGTFGGTNSEAWDINNSGQVVGGANNASNYQHAFLYNNGTKIDLGTLGGNNSLAYGINDNGQVVGYAYTASHVQHAFLYNNSAMSDLGTLGGTWSMAYGINDSGQVVGSAVTAGGVQHAFLYSGGGMTDLNTLLGYRGWTLSDAKGINDLGQIVGTGTVNGQTHAYLMMPDMAPVPVPTTSWLLGSGLLGLVGVARKRKAA